MARKEFNEQHPTGEQLSMIHYNFDTSERTIQPAVIMGTKPDEDPDEFLVCVRFTTKGDEFEMDPISFGILSNTENF